MIDLNLKIVILFGVSFFHLAACVNGELFSVRRFFIFFQLYFTFLQILIFPFNFYIFQKILRNKNWNFFFSKIVFFPKNCLQKMFMFRPKNQLNRSQWICWSQNWLLTPYWMNQIRNIGGEMRNFTWKMCSKIRERRWNYEKQKTSFYSWVMACHWPQWRQRACIWVTKTTVCLSKNLLILAYQRYMITNWIVIEFNLISSKFNELYIIHAIFFIIC